MTTKLWPLIILKFFNKDLVDCKNISKIDKNNAKLKTGRVSKRIIAKFCQYVATVEKSEKIKEKKLINLELSKSEMSILRDGANPAKDPNNIKEKIITFLKTKRRSSL